MANEIKRFFFGSQASPVAQTLLESGSLTLDFDGESIGPLAYDDDATDWQTAFEAHSEIGVGNVSISAYTVDGDTVGYTVTFTGALANLDIIDITVTSNTLKQKADTITLTVTTPGVDEVPCVPSISTTTTAVEPVAGVNEVQRLFNNSTGTNGGSFDVNGNGTSVTIDFTNGTTKEDLQDAMDDMWGSGHVVVTDSNLNPPFFFEFIGSYAKTPVPQMTISNDSTAYAFDVDTHTEGVTEVTGVHQVDSIEFNSTAVAGTMTIDGQNCDWNEYADEVVTITGATLNHKRPQDYDPEDDTTWIRITWNSYVVETPVAVTDGSDPTKLLSVVGVNQIIEISFDDAPDDGDAWLIRNAIGHATINPGDTAEAVQSQINNSYGSGGDQYSVAGEYVVTSPFYTNDSWEFNEVTPLRKACGAEVVTVQEGTGPPDVPSGLTATVFNHRKIDLQWVDESDNETGFEIQKSFAGENDWLPVATVDADSTTYQVSGLTPETEYDFRVRAVNDDGDSDWSNTATETTDAAPVGGAALPSKTTITIGLHL